MNQLNIPSSKYIVLAVLFLSLTSMEAQRKTIILTKDGKTTKLKYNKETNLILGVKHSGETEIMQVINGKMVSCKNDIIAFKISSETECIKESEDCYKSVETMYNENFEPTRKINIEDIYFLQKAPSKSFTAFHGISFLLSTAFVHVLNPIIARNYDQGEQNGKLWLKAHVISSMISIESVLALSMNKRKKYYLKDEDGGSVWKIVMDN